MIMRIPEGEPRTRAAEGRSYLRPLSLALRYREMQIIPLNRIALASGGAFFVLAMSLGNVQGAGLINAAETPTPTRTPTMAATPNAVQRQIAELQATAVALRQQREDERKLAEAKATVTALEATPTITPIPTPPRSPAEATATADTIRLRALGEEQARGKATATARAEQTATAEANRVATVQARETAAAATSRAAERNQDGGGIAGILLLTLTALGAGGFIVFLRRKSIANSRFGTWVRNRFGGGAPAAGGGP